MRFYFYWYELPLNSTLKHHPFVVSLLGVSANPFCIISELMEGDLWGLLKDEKFKINNELQIQFSSQIATGMNHLHV